MYTLAETYQLMYTLATRPANVYISWICTFATTYIHNIKLKLCAKHVLALIALSRGLCAFLLLNFRNAPAPAPAPLPHIKLLHVNSVSSVKWDDGTQWDLVLGLPVE